MDPNQLVSMHFEKSPKDLRFESWELEYLDIFEDMLACHEARSRPITSLLIQETLLHHIQFLPVALLHHLLEATHSRQARSKVFLSTSLHLHLPPNHPAPQEYHLQHRISPNIPAINLVILHR